MVDLVEADSTVIIRNLWCSVIIHAYPMVTYVDAGSFATCLCTSQSQCPASKQENTKQFERIALTLRPLLKLHLEYQQFWVWY